MSLYKYVGPERVDILANTKIRFSQPSTFNDPFESLPSFQEFLRGGLRNDIMTNVFKPIDQGSKFLIDGDHILSEEEVALYKASLSEKYREWEAELVRDFVENMRRDLFDQVFGVLSLTENPCSLLMWSHYADSHRGILIEFEESHPFFHEPDRVRRVVYSKTRRKKALVSGRRVDFDAMLYRKSSEWKYEREWRLVSSLARASERIPVDPLEICLVEIPPDCFRSVTIGARATDTTRAAVLRLVTQDQKFSHIKLMQARLHESDYRLDYHSVVI